MFNKKKITADCCLAKVAPEKITYSPWSMWFTVYARDKAPLRVHAMISGIREFKEFIMKNLPEDKWLQAHEKSSQDNRING